MVVLGSCGGGKEGICDERVWHEHERSCSRSWEGWVKDEHGWLGIAGIMGIHKRS